MPKTEGGTFVTPAMLADGEERSMRRSTLLIAVLATAALTLAGLAGAARPRAARPAAAPAAAPARVPATLTAVPVATGLERALRVHVRARRHGSGTWSAGRVRSDLHPDPTDHDRLFTDISAVNGDGERGALGIALHPNWPARRTCTST